MTEINRNVRLLVGGVAALLALSLTACSSTTAGRPRAAAPVAKHTAPVGTGAHQAPLPRTTKAAPRRQVHASFFEGDGSTYGVGMPVIMRFSAKVTDPAAFERTVRVTLNGAPAGGAWFWQQSATGYAIEAHYRLAHFWPAHSTIQVSAPLDGVSAGHGRAFDDSATLSMKIGAAHISTVDASSTDPQMVVTSDGKDVRTLPASLGKADTPTYRGTKIVEEFDREQDMGGTEVPWSVRLTNTGEFVHAAPWNDDIGHANLSHGCTNLTTDDARWFYKFSLLGDVVQYPNAPGPTMKEWDGMGDWNLTWDEWRSGGSI